MSMQAYEEAQNMILAGCNRAQLDLRDEIEMHLVKTYPDLNARGLIPTIVRRAYRDLARV